MPIFVMPDGDRLVVPRVLARTAVVTRSIVAVPDGFALVEDSAPASEVEVDPERQALGDERLQFWIEFLGHLSIDDPEQLRPKAARMGYISVMMPAPSGSSWLTVYREAKKNTVGLFLSASRNSAGEYAMNAVANDWKTVGDELGGTAVRSERDGRATVGDQKVFGSLEDAEQRRAAFTWLAERVNTFVNVVRPRVRSAVADYLESERGVS